jgi:hypothetical protein
MTHVEITYIAEINGCTPKISVGTRFEGFSHVQEVQPGSGKIICDLEFKPFDALSIRFSDKAQNTWLQMTHIEIDYIQLDALIFSGKQYPDYSGIDFNHRSSPIYYDSATRFDLNAVYELEIYLPIWHFRTKGERVKMEYSQ